MIQVRSADSRGLVSADWICSRRTFSFGSYWNPAYPHWRVLQTINDDRVEPGGHVPVHSHSNMEIFGYVVAGICTHTDSTGCVREVPAGSVQRMSSGTGISHTEGNSHDQQARYLQLWIRPDREGGEPLHDVYQFDPQDRCNQLFDITQVLPIRSRTRVWAGQFDHGRAVSLDPARDYYLYVVLGGAAINGHATTEGTGLAITAESQLIIQDPVDLLEILLFDMPVDR